MSVAPVAPAPSVVETPSPASPPPESPAPEKKGATESISDAPTDLKVEPKVEKPLKVEDPKVEPKPDKGESTEFDVLELFDVDEKLKKSLKGKTVAQKGELLKFLKDAGLLKVNVTLGNEGPNSPSELLKERRGAVQPVGAKTATGGFKVT